jgi:hypothetical protein
VLQNWLKLFGDMSESKYILRLMDLSDTDLGYYKHALADCDTLVDIQHYPCTSACFTMVAHVYGTSVARGCWSHFFIDTPPPHNGNVNASGVRMSICTGDRCAHARAHTSCVRVQV